MASFSVLAAPKALSLIPSSDLTQGMYVDEIETSVLSILCSANPKTANVNLICSMMEPIVFGQPLLSAGQTQGAGLVTGVPACKSVLQSQRRIAFLTSTKGKLKHVNLVCTHD